MEQRKNHQFLSKKDLIKTFHDITYNNDIGNRRITCTIVTGNFQVVTGEAYCYDPNNIDVERGKRSAWDKAYANAMNLEISRQSDLAMRAGLLDFFFKYQALV